MQMRFDGKLGFTGGIIELDDESIEIGISREMQEEMGIDPKLHPLSKENFIMSQPFDCASLPDIKTLYFYALRVEEDQILNIENNARHAIHYGEEVQKQKSHATYLKNSLWYTFLSCFYNDIFSIYQVLGWIRVPLYTMEDGYNGFPAFLDNNFVGNAREQLLEALIKTGVMTKDETSLALMASKSTKS